MEYMVFALLLIFTPMILCLVDRRIKGCRSVFIKILSVIAVMSFLFVYIYFYGKQMLWALRVNVKSFTNLKAFFNSRILVMLAILLLFLVIALKVTFNTFVFKSFTKKEYKLEKVVMLSFMVLELALVPNIFTSENVLVVLGIVNLLEIGLVYSKLVFSNASQNRKEVLA